MYEVMEKWNSVWLRGFQVDGNSAGEGSKACNEICSMFKVEGSSVSASK